MIKKIVRNHTLAGALALAGSVLFASGTSASADASTWTGATDNKFGTATNWTGNVGPSPTNDALFASTVVSPVTVSASTDARSITVDGGAVSLSIAVDTTLALKNNGLFSIANGSALSLTGGLGSLVTSAAVQTWGDVNLATKITLDGGSVDDPVRSGRYAIVVGEGGELTLENGADITVGNATGGTGVKTLIRVGEMTAEGGVGVGVMNIEDGAKLTAGSKVGSGNWTGFHVGDFGGEGVVNQTGGTVDLFGGLTLGNQASGATADLGSKGTYNLSGGTLNIYRPAGDNGALIIGRATADRYSEGILNVSGGLLDLGAVGGALGDVAMVVGGEAKIDATIANAKGTVNQTGGIVRFTNAKLIFGRGQGTYNLNGGTLEIGGTNGISATAGGTPTFNFGGGTLKVINSNLTTDVRATLVDGTVSTIDTNGRNAVFANGLAGSGGFAKVGAGALVLNGLTNLDAASTVIGLLKVGSGTGNVGTLNLGADITVEVANTVGRLQIGVDGGSGIANFSEGASFTIDDSGASGGAWGTLDIGRGAGSVGVLNHSDGLVDLSGGALQIGYSGGNGTYNLSDDAELSLDTASSIFLGSGDGAVGLLTISDDAILTSDSQVFIGAGDGATGTVTQTGGQASFTGTLFALGTDSDETSNSPGTGIYNMEGGTAVFENLEHGLLIGTSSGGSGEFNQSGGRVTVTNTVMRVGDYGVYNQSGGVLEIGGNNLVGTGAFNFGGGTIKVIGSALNTDVNANLVADKISTIDTNELNAVWAGDITAAGLHQIGQGGSKLTKKGLGMLSFTGNGTRKLDTFAIEGGAGRQTAGTTSAVEFMVGTGAGSIGTYLMDGGTLQINPSTKKADGSAVSGSLRVGDFNGTGTFNQTGGAVNLAPNSALVIGNRGGTGTYNASGGTVQLSAALNILGRNDAEDGNPLNLGFAKDLGSSEGTLNISGNSLIELLSGGSLVLSSNVVTVNAAIGRASKGTINQTGGTLRINNGASLFLGAAGDGEYNLDGGVLEIGGNSLKGVYNNIGGAYAFNLGGGTVKVIGSNLTTDVRATLVNGTVSTIDTNGRNAVFANGLAGTGGFAKSGTGAMILGGNSVLGGDSTSEGDLVISGPGATPASFTVDEDTTLDIHRIAGGQSNLIVGSGAGQVGTLHIVEGGAVTLHSEGGNSNLHIGMGGGTGTVEMIGGSLTFDNAGGGYNRLRVGSGTGSTGTFNQSSGTVDTADGSFVIGFEGGTGTYNLSGDAALTVGNIFQIGRGLPDNSVVSRGTLNISDNAVFHMTNTASGWLALGLWGSHGTINQSGSSQVTVDTALNIVFGEGGDSSGTYQLDGGDLVMRSTGGIFVGNTASSTGTFTQTAGTSLFEGGLLRIGNQGEGTFTVSGGTATVKNGIAVSNTVASKGTLEIGGDGVLEVGGGEGIKKGDGTAVFNMSGGKLRVIDNDLSVSVDANLTAATTSTIDTNGFEATFTGTISGPGNLTKAGTGELTVVESANIGTLLVSAGSAAFMSDYTGVDVILDGGDADFKGAINHVTGDVTVGDGSQLMGSLSADGATTIETGGTHQLCDESVVSAGSYRLEGDAVLILDLTGTYLDVARLSYASITLENDSRIVLYSLGALDLSESIFLFNTSNLFTGSVNIQGAGAIADYEFELRSDGYVTITAVPEPSVMVLLVLALGFVVIFQMKKRRQA